MFTRPPTRRLARSLISAGAAMILAATGLAATGSGAQAAPSDKIRPELTKELQGKTEGDF